jgi:hypothetical protein
MLFKKHDNLIFFRNYIYNGQYSSSNRFKIEKINTILKKIRKNNETTDTVNIKSEFNNINYAMYDLDDEQKLDLFTKIYPDESYVIFQSSENHYWAFLDMPYKKLSSIFECHNWKICNDQHYTSMCRKLNIISIRGLYENKDRKPIVIKTQGDLSENFQKFIKKLENYYNNEGFELSVLRYRDNDMLIKYNRKLKIKNLKNVENER